LADFHQDHQKQNGGFPLLAYLTQTTHLKPCKRFYAYWQQVETQCLPNSLPRKIGKGVKLQ
jgi:hypothetical protein